MICKILVTFLHINSQQPFITEAHPLLFHCIWHCLPIHKIGHTYCQQDLIQVLCQSFVENDVLRWLYGRLWQSLVVFGILSNQRFKGKLTNATGQRTRGKGTLYVWYVQCTLCTINSHISEIGWTPGKDNAADSDKRKFKFVIT